MIRIMVVDDEKITRDGVAKGIDWAKHGITVLGCAENGMEALYLAQELEPDIILSDIHMPVMDGLGFAQRLSVEMPSVRIIIISAHQEFEYAKKALSYGVEDYLLKPLQEDELVRRVLEVGEKQEIIRTSELKRNLDFLLLRGDSRFAQELGQLEAELFIAFELRQDEAAAEVLEKISLLFEAETDNRVFQSECLRQLVKFKEIMARWALETELGNIDYLAENELYRFRDRQNMLTWQMQKVRELINMARISKGSKYAKLVRQVECHVAEHYAEDITLRAAAGLLFISPQYLSRIFRQEKGLSFIEWLNAYRIEKAKEFLADTQERITNVAGMVGYNDYKYFSNVFKKYTGMSPREYRKTGDSI